jgi:hypothetical protein
MRLVTKAKSSAQKPWGREMAALRHWVNTRLPSLNDASRAASLLNRTSVALTKCATPLFARAALPENGERVFVLAAMLRQQARELRSLTCKGGKFHVLAKEFSYKAFWNDLPLTLLALGMPKVNGKVPYSDIAYLLEAASTALGDGREISPEALRKQHARFVKRFKPKQVNLRKDFLNALTLDYTAD